jgi:hypothetical protein
VSLLLEKPADPVCDFATLADPGQDTKNFLPAEVVAARRKTAFDLTSFSQTRLEGKVTLDQRSVLVLQTPFDRGWHAFQDGKAVPVTKSMSDCWASD